MQARTHTPEYMQVHFAWLTAPQLLFETEKVCRLGMSKPHPPPRTQAAQAASHLQAVKHSPGSLPRPRNEEGSGARVAQQPTRLLRCAAGSHGLAQGCPLWSGLHHTPGENRWDKAREKLVKTSHLPQPLVPSTRLSNFKSWLKVELCALAPGALKGRLRGAVLWCRWLFPTYLSGIKTQGRNKSFWFGSWNKKSVS